MKETVALYKSPEGLLQTNKDAYILPIDCINRGKITSTFMAYQKEMGIKTPDIDAYVKDYNRQLKELEEKKGDAVGNTWSQRKKRFNKNFDETIRSLNKKYFEGYNAWYASKVTKICSLSITFKNGIDKWQKEKAISNVINHLNIKSFETLRKIPNVKSVDIKGEL